MNSDMTLITKENYSKIFEAFELISHDSGNQAGHKNYAIPMSWSDKLDKIENTLSRLSPAQFEILCIGEESEKNILLRRNVDMCLVDNFLQEFFEEV